MFVEQKYFIGYRDVDTKLNLNNTSLLAFLENTAGKHSKLANNSVNTKSTWMLLFWKIKMFDKPKFGEEINIKTWSRKMEKCYGFRDFEMYNDENKKIGIASSKWVFIDLEKGKISKVSEDIAKNYDSEDVCVFEEKDNEFNKLEVPNTFEKCIEFKITKNMIDSNKHLHNIYYMDFANEILPEDVDINSFEIMYKKEVKYGDVIKVLYSCVNNEHIVTIKNEDETELHAIIMIK